MKSTKVSDPMSTRVSMTLKAMAMGCTKRVSPISCTKHHWKLEKKMMIAIMLWYRWVVKKLENENSKTTVPVKTDNMQQKRYCVR